VLLRGAGQHKQDGVIGAAQDDLAAAVVDRSCVRKQRSEHVGVEPTEQQRVACRGDRVHLVPSPFPVLQGDPHHVPRPRRAAELVSA